MGSPGAIQFDESLWPLIIVRFTGTPTNAQFEGFLATRQTHLDRGEKHVIIYDTVNFRVLSNEQRQRLIDWFKERKAIQKQLSLGTALVITSPIMRMTLSSILHFTQTGTQYHVARSLPEAARWAAMRLDEARFSEVAQRVRVAFGLTPKSAGHGLSRS